MAPKLLKFTPQLAELIKRGEKTTTFRLFDDKNLTAGDELILAERDGDKVTQFATAVITDVMLRTIETLQPEDYAGHEPVRDPLVTYQKYYGSQVQPTTEVKVIKFKLTRWPGQTDLAPLPQTDVARSL